MIRKRSFGVLVAAALATALLGGTAAAETVLLPLVIYWPEAGANGAEWRTDLTIWNANDAWWFGIWGTQNCVLPAVFGMDPHSVARNPICTPENGAAMLSLPDELASKVHFRLRVLNVVSGETFGTPLPVVRSAEMRRGRSALVDFVQDERRYRRTIRIINPSTTSPLRGLLRFLPYHTSQPLREFRIEVPAASFAMLPASKVISDNEIGWLEDDFNNVEFLPDDADVPYFWFASLTSNATNVVSILTPQ
jgi:hypothetical protein